MTERAHTQGVPVGRDVRFAPENIAVGLAAVVLSSLYAIRIFSADTWWHLAAGRWIWANKQIPTNDPFSFVANGSEWIYVDWLPEAIMYGVWAVGGFTALVLLKMLLAGSVLGLTGASSRTSGASGGAAVGVMIAVGVLAQTRYSMMRPNLFGALLLALGIFIVLRWGGRGGRLLWLLPVVQWVWLPTHGSAIVGLGLAGAAVFGAVILRRPRREWVQAAAVLVACFSVFLLSESGRHIITHVVELDGTSNGLNMTVEWRRTDWRQTQAWFPLGFTVVGVIYSLVRIRSIPFVFAMALGGLGLARGFERNLAEGVVMSAPAVALAITQLGAALRAKELRLPALVLGPALGVLIAAGHLGVEPDIGLNTRFGFGTDESRYPHDTLATLRELPYARTMNSFGIGGYLIWQEIPGGVFADGRTVAVYTDEIFDAWVLPTMQDEAGVNRIADHFEIQYGLATGGSLQGRIMMTSSDWLPVHHGESTSLFVRRGFAGGVVEAGHPILNELRWDEEPGWNDRWYAAVLASPAGRAGLTESLRQSASQSPANPVLNQVLMHLASRAPDVVRAAGLGPPID